MKSLFKKILFFSFLFTASVNLFAQVPKGLESLGDTVLGIFTGNLVKTILICKDRSGLLNILNLETHYKKQYMLNRLDS